MRRAEHHPGPVRDECLRRSEPKTAAAAGDEVNPAVQSKIHPAILPVWGPAAVLKASNEFPALGTVRAPCASRRRPFSPSTMAL